MALLASPTLPRRLFLWSTVAALLIVSLGAGLVLLNPAKLGHSGSVASAETSDGYFVEFTVMSFSDVTHEAIGWGSIYHGKPDRILLVSSTDAERLRNGQSPRQILGEWDAMQVGTSSGYGGTNPIWGGHVDFKVPLLACLPENGCHDNELATVVWMKGASWKGHALQYGQGQTEGFGSLVPGPAVSISDSQLWEPLVVAAPWLAGLAWTSGVIAVLAGGWWAWAAVRSNRASASTGVDRDRATSTEEMLRLVHISELYVTTISRHFMVSAAVIVALAVAAFFLVLVPADAHVGEQFSGLGSGRLSLESLFYGMFELAVPFALAVCFVFWGVHFRRVRSELRRWHDLAKHIESQAATILG